MTKEKRQQLKAMARLNILAEKVGTDAPYLSRIINNQVRPSVDLAERIAITANQMLFAQKLAEILELADLIIEEQFTAQDFLEKD
jgi:transcriptional regulator with XRE-family HTH domain